MKPRPLIVLIVSVCIAVLGYFFVKYVPFSGHVESEPLEGPVGIYKK